MIKKLWKFLWEDDSMLSYFSFVIVAFIFLKFLFYPVFLYLFGLEDIVSVLSGSMTHDNDYKTWYLQNGFSESEIASWPFKNGLGIGDAVLVISPDDIFVGDVIVFKKTNGESIIHRVIKIDENGVTTHGDANSGTLSFEQGISPTQIVGEAKYRIPFVGVPRMLLNRLTGY